MNSFSFFQPTKVKFGLGISDEVGKFVGKYGSRCLIVAYHPMKLVDTQMMFIEKIKFSLKRSSIEIDTYLGALPNPDVHCIDQGVEAARKFDADVVLAIGGGSVIDTSKMIAFRLANPEISWDTFFSDYAVPFNRSEALCKRSIPLIAITTTSGTGSQVTQAAVITNPITKQKTSIFHTELFPNMAIVDPQVMLPIPTQVTADTGFDAFTHAFESYINARATPYSEIFSLEAMRLIFRWLPEAVKNGDDLEARTAMALADTFAGISLASAGAALPHPMGEAIGSLYSHIPHGRSMAVFYPEFMRFSSVCAVEKFARVGRLLNPKLENVPDQIASVKMCADFDRFLQKVGLLYSLKDLGIDIADLEEEIDRLGKFTIHFTPRPASAEDIRKILEDANKR